jgi:hypothetical protein
MKALAISFYFILLTLQLLEAASVNHEFLKFKANNTTTLKT